MCTLAVPNGTLRVCGPPLSILTPKRTLDVKMSTSIVLGWIDSIGLTRLVVDLSLLTKVDLMVVWVFYVFWDY